MCLSHHGSGHIVDVYGNAQLFLAATALAGYKTAADIADISTARARQIILQGDHLVQFRGLNVSGSLQEQKPSLGQYR